MDTETQKALNILNEARRIVLLPSAYPSRDDIIALVMLALALEQNGKEVAALLAPETRRDFPAHLPWPGGATDAHTLAETLVITIDTLRYPIETLSYEQDDAALRIYLKPVAAAPPAEALSLAPLQARPECVLTVGAARFDDLPQRERLQTLLEETQVINIDTDPANEGFGDANMLAPHGGLVETARDLAGALAPQSPAVELWSKETEPKPLPLPALRLLGRIMARLTQERGFTTALLTAGDFERSALSKETFGNSLAKFSLESPLLPKPLAVFWPTNDSLAGVLLANEKRLYRALGQLGGSYTLDGYRFELAQNALETLRKRLAEICAAAN